MQSPDNNTSNRQNAKGPIDKKIQIETCRDCKTHRSNTWHDETKYEVNFNLVKAALEALTPEVEVIRKVDGPINLGAFEIKHGEQLIYSKKNTGLWPNAKAVAQRVKNYFEDLEAGKNVSNYGKQKEKAVVQPKKAPSDTRASTAGFHSKLGASTNSQGSNKGLATPQKAPREDSAGGSPGEEHYEGGQDTIKGHEEEENQGHHDHHDHHDEPKSGVPTHMAAIRASATFAGEEAQADRIASPKGVAQGHEETKEDSHHNKSEQGATTPKETTHEAASPHVQENTQKPEENKQVSEPATPATPQEEKKVEAQPDVPKEEASSPAKPQETHEAPQTPLTAGNEPKSADVLKEKKEEGKPQGKTEGKEDEYADDFTS